MEDRRNWKCFIGMHQMEEFSKPELVNVFDLGLSTTRPVKIKKIFIMKCAFCGKIEEYEVIL